MLIAFALHDMIEQVYGFPKKSAQQVEVIGVGG